MHYWRFLILVLAVTGAVAALSERPSIDVRQECPHRRERDSTISRPGSNCFRRLPNDQENQIKEREDTRLSRIDKHSVFFNQRRRNTFGGTHEDRAEIRRYSDTRLNLSDRVISHSFDRRSRDIQNERQNRYQLSTRHQLNSHDEQTSRDSDSSDAGVYHRVRISHDTRSLEQLRTRSQEDGSFRNRIRSASKFSVRLRASRSLSNENHGHSDKGFSERSLKTSSLNRDIRWIAGNTAIRSLLPRQLDSRRMESTVERRMFKARESDITTRKELRSRNIPSTDRLHSQRDQSKENLHRRISLHSDHGIEVTGIRQSFTERPNRILSPSKDIRFTSVENQQMSRPRSSQSRKNEKINDVLSRHVSQRIKSQSTNRKYQIQKTLISDTNADRTRSNNANGRDQRSRSTNVDKRNVRTVIHGRHNENPRTVNGERRNKQLEKTRMGISTEIRVERIDFSNRKPENTERRITTRNRTPSEDRAMSSGRVVSVSFSSASQRDHERLSEMRNAYDTATQHQRTRSSRSLSKHDINWDYASRVNAGIIASVRSGRTEDRETRRNRRHVSEHFEEQDYGQEPSRRSLLRQSDKSIRELPERIDDSPSKINERFSAQANFRFRRETPQSEGQESNIVRFRPNTMQQYFHYSSLITELSFYSLQGIYVCAILYNFVGGFGRGTKNKISTSDLWITHPGKGIKME